MSKLRNYLNPLFFLLGWLGVLATIPKADATVYSVITNTGTFAVSVTIDDTETNFPINHLILGSQETAIWTNGGTTGNNSWGQLYIARFSAWTTNGQPNITFYGRTMFDAQTNRVTAITSNKVYWNENQSPATGYGRWYPGNNPTNWVKSVVDAISGTTPFCWQNSMVHTGMCRIGFNTNGLYRYGQVVNLTSADNSNIRVSTLVTGQCKQVFSGASPASLTDLPNGYYFAENSDDRITFMVLPPNYSPSSWIETEGPTILSSVGDTMFNTYTNMGFNWLRMHYDHNWNDLQTNGVPAGENPATWAWNRQNLNYPQPNGIDDIITNSYNAPLSNSMVNIIVHADNAPTFYATNTRAVYMAGWTNYVGAIMQHFKPWADQGRLYIEILNEPGYDKADGAYGWASAIPFDHAGCPPLNWDGSNPQCWQAYTNWGNMICDLVETTMAVRAMLHSGAKIYAPSHQGWEGYELVPRLLAQRGITTNGLAGISFHDAALDLTGVDFYYPSYQDPILSWANHTYTNNVDLLANVRSSIGPNIPLYVDESEYGSKSAISDTPYAKRAADYYNNINLNWRQGQQRVLKEGVLLLANKMQMWNGVMNFVGWPGESPGSLAGGVGDFESTAFQFPGFEAGHGMKAHASAILQLAHLTKDYEPYSFVRTNRHIMAVFNNYTNKTTRTFKWMAEGETQAVSIPPGSVLKDIYGNTMNQTNLTDEVGYYDQNIFAPQTVPCFTNYYSIWGTNLLNMLPATNQGIYYRGEVVTVSNSIPTPIEVYDFYSRPVASGYSPLSLTNLQVGHYWVQCVGTNGFGDRSQFTMLPAGWHSLKYVGATEMGYAWYGAENRGKRIKASIIRGGQSGWREINVVEGSNDWTLSDQTLGFYTNSSSVIAYPTRLVYNIVNAPDWVIPRINGTPTIGTLCSTNWDAFREAYTNFCYQIASRYGTNFIYELFNEAYYGALWEYPTNDWPLAGYGSTNWEVHLAYTIGAAVDVIHSVSQAKYGSTTNIEIWAPAWQSTDGRMDQITNSVTRAYYNKVDAITWHNGDVSWGPVDNGKVYHLESYWPWQYIDNSYTVAKQVVDTFPGKKYYIDESYAPSPDPLGRTNLIGYNYVNAVWSNAPSANHTNTWKDIQNRYIKQNVLFKQAGITGVKPENFDSCCNGSMPPTDDSAGYVDWVGWYGWTERQPGSPDGVGIGRIAGMNPQFDAFLMTAYWLENAKWLGGNVRSNIHSSAWLLKDGRLAQLVWADDLKTNTLPPSATNNVSVYNIYGQIVSPTPITDEPRLFIYGKVLQTGPYRGSQVPVYDVFGNVFGEQPITNIVGTLQTLPRYRLAYPLDVSTVGVPQMIKGLHFSTNDNDLAQQANVGWVRLWDMDPYGGVFKGGYAPSNTVGFETTTNIWRDCTNVLTSYKSAGFKIDGVLCNQQPWRTLPGSQDSLPDIRTPAPVITNNCYGCNPWQQYVYQATKQYAGFVDAWEIWNEPYLRGVVWGARSGFDGDSDWHPYMTPEQVVEITRQASMVIRTNDPTAIVVSPSLYFNFWDQGEGNNNWADWVDTDWSTNALSLGLANWVDVIAFHAGNWMAAYPAQNPLHPTMVDVFNRGMDLLRSYTHKPVWNTEWHRTGLGSWQYATNDTLFAQDMATGWNTMLNNNNVGAAFYYWGARTTKSPANIDQTWWEDMFTTNSIELWATNITDFATDRQAH